MNRIKLISFIVILSISLPFTYGGCVLVITTGDVNKEKDSDDSNDSPVFSGNNSQAVIDSNNVKDLSVGAFAGGITRAKAAIAGFRQNPVTTQAGTFRSLMFPLVLMKSIQRVETASAPIGSFKPGAETRKGTMRGICGGKFLYSIDFIYESSIFNGHFTFENYCDRGVSISGQTVIDGTYGVDAGDITTAHFSFSNLSDGYLTLDGEISLDFSNAPIIAIFSSRGKDIESGQVYWLKDYSLNIIEFAGFIETEIFGTFYHPEHGFVNFSTTEPFIVHDEDDWPTSGLFMIQGRENTKAELKALDPSAGFVAADIDGNGVFDWDSGILIWADM